MSEPTRRARVSVVGLEADSKADTVNDFLDRIKALLPENYKVGYNSSNGQIIVTGHDVAGWTMDLYVIPRLASGLIFAEEITE